MKKHRGEIVETAIRKSGFPFKTLAKRLNISRNTLYNRFKNPDLSDEFIITVSNIIHYNFAIDFPELGEAINNLAHEGGLQYVDHNTAELLKLEKKYTHLLERHNELLSVLVKMANINELAPLRKEVLRILENEPQ